MPGLEQLRSAGYNVITWDPRGEFASGGVLQWDSPFYEGRDVTAILNWAQGINTTDPANNNAYADKVGTKFGMVGVSYGGAIQLVSAALDSRIDAIVPVITWNSLNSSFYPNSAYKTAFDSLLSSTHTNVGITTFNVSGVTADLLGVMSQAGQALLASSGPTVLVNNVHVPTLLIQGTVDELFPLDEAMATEQALAANGVTVKTIWYCGGHGDCLDPASPLQNGVILDSTMAWLDSYVKDDGTSAESIPPFEYVDQNGDVYQSALLPTDPHFNTGTIAAHSTGGALVLVPLIGGSGPLPSNAGALLPNAGGAPAKNAINVTIPASVSTQYIAGSPQLAFTYSGVGTSRSVYAQIVDNTTQRVVGNIVTPIPVTLDGQKHQINIPMEAIAYTADPTDSLTLQITSSATAFESLLQFGYINISDINLTLPTTTAVTPETSIPV